MNGTLRLQHQPHAMTSFAESFGMQQDSQFLPAHRPAGFRNQNIHNNLCFNDGASCCCYGANDLVWLDSRQTFELHGPRTISPKTGTAFHRVRQDEMPPAIGPRSARISRPEQRHHRRPHRRRNMHRSGIVGDQDSRLSATNWAASLQGSVL